MSAPILVVDDDPKILTLVRTYLEREGFAVVSAGDGKAALTAFAKSMPRLIVLDIMLPELDGLALMRIVRERSEVPIILLSARASTADRVYGIHEGADDYVVKPFSPAELVVRVKAVLRRTEHKQGPPTPQGVKPFGELTIDLDRLEVRRGRERIALTAAEFKLLTALVVAEGRVLTRQALLDALYGPVEGDALERTIDVHIRRLREKLGDSAETPMYIATVRGAGYRALQAPLPALPPQAGGGSEPRRAGGGSETRRAGGGNEPRRAGGGISPVERGQGISK